MKFKISRKNIVILFVVIIGLFTFFRWQNNSIVISDIVIENDSIPKPFEGYRILHISDLHNKEFGTHQDKILAKIKKIKPDLIVVTGDLIDSNKTNIDVAMDLINGAVGVAPVFFVTGNHEAWSGSYNTLKARLEHGGVTVLDNQQTEIYKGNTAIEIMGLADPAFMGSDSGEFGTSVKIENLLSTLAEDDHKFRILLSHRPELFDVYAKSNIDLVFSGHAHGGQFRLPMVGGLIAPNQGFFPKFTQGIHRKNQTSMVISRGLGNSIVPIRIFNRPELIVVTLATP